MFIITKVEIGLTTVVPARTWSDVIPLLKINKTVRIMTVSEDGKLILRVKNPPYERMQHASLLNLLDLRPGGIDE